MRFLLKRFSNASMLWKFTIIYFLLIMVPTAAIWISYYRWSAYSTRDQTDKFMMQTVSRLKQDILYTVKNTENIAEEIVFSSDVQAFLNNDFTFSENEVYYFIYYIQNKLINIKHLYPNKYYKIRIYSSNSSIGEEYDILYSIDRIKDKEYFKAVKEAEGRKIWGKVKKAEEYYDINESIRPVRNKDIVIPLYERITPIMSDRLIGILEIDILVEKMFGEPSELVAGENGVIMVMDSSGEVISPVTDEKQKLKNCLVNSVFKGDTGVAEFKDECGHYRIVYDTVPEIGYKILAALPYEEISERMPMKGMSLAVWVLLGTAAVFFITYLTTNFLFSRFRLLIGMMKRVENGDFDVRIEEDRNDEVGELARGFNRMAGRLEEMVLNLIEKETAHREAEVRALHSQINPHFLYNTLESLRMESEIRGEEDIADALASLGRLLRYSIKWVGGITTLWQEIEHVKNYITIMKVRYRGKIDFSCNIQDKALDCTVIKMMLQPLVENCFNHAFKEMEGIWKVGVHSYIQGEDLHIQIIDNGKGIEPEKLEELNRCLSENREITVDKKAGSSIGIWNVNKRIKMQFGDSYGICVKNGETSGTVVEIIIPARSI